MLEKKTFAMSTYLSKADLYKAKAKYYEEQAEKLEMALAVALETVSHLEVTTLKLAQDKDKLLDHLEASSVLLERLSN